MPLLCFPFLLFACQPSLLTAFQTTVPFLENLHAILPFLLSAFPVYSFPLLSLLPYLLLIVTRFDESVTISQTKGFPGGALEIVRRKMISKIRN
jgi:hypothetical protein